MKIKIPLNLFILFSIFLSGSILLSCSDSEDEEIIDTVNIEISLDKNNESIKVSQELKIIPTFKGTDAEKLEYIWTSSNPEVASVVKNADNSATVTALTTGNATIQIASSKYSQFTATCIITVTARSYKILAIGNSFSQDAVEQYLYELAAAEGFNPTIGNLFIGGCSLEKHLTNANNNSAAYEYRKIVNGVKAHNRLNVTLAEGLADEEWDYISLQQVSGNSGQYETYVVSLPDFIKYVKERATNKDVTLMLHQTWAYASNSGHDDFPKYDSNQIKMYEAIVDAVNKAAGLVDIDIVIPSGTAIQNGRTTYIGDNFNRDGYHLETTYGRYTAACTWFEKIFGKSVVGNSYAPEGLHTSRIEIAQNAAHAAVLKPNEVTVLEKYKEHPIDTEILKVPVYIDFGSSMSGTPWNNVTSNIAAEKGYSLIDEDGDYTKFTIKVTKGFSQVYAGVGSEPTATVNMGFDVPATVFKDGLLVGGENPGELQISNLDPALKYSFTIVGLRWNSTVTRTTDYKITGKDSQTYSLAVGTKNADDVKDKYITANEIMPDTSGNITIEVSRGADNPHQAVISAIRIAPVE